MGLLLQLYAGDDWAWLVGSVAIQIAAVVLVAGALAKIGRRAGAAWRHSVWLTALVCLLLSPVFTCLLDAAGITVIAVRQSVRPASPPHAAQAQPRSSSLSSHPAPAPDIVSGRRPGTQARTSTSEAAANVRLSKLLRAIAGAAVAVWILGASWILLRLWHGLRVVSVLRRGVRPLAGDAMAELLAEVRQTLGVNSLPSIVISTSVGRPIVVGLVRPLVIVPEGVVQSLSQPNLADVLVHECAHVVCRHPIAGLLQRIATVIFWPHPLVHLLNRELTRAREEVCDNYVLRRGQPCRYAKTLLELSQSLGEVFPRPAAIGLFHSQWTLEDRIAGLLDRRRKTMVRINRWLCGILAAILFVPALLIAGTRVLEAAPTTQKQPAQQEAVVFVAKALHSLSTIESISADYTVSHSSAPGVLMRYRYMRSDDRVYLEDRTLDEPQMESLDSDFTYHWKKTDGVVFASVKELAAGKAAFELHHTPELLLGTQIFDARGVGLIDVLTDPRIVVDAEAHSVTLSGFAPQRPGGALTVEVRFDPNHAFLPKVIQTTPTEALGGEVRYLQRWEVLEYFEVKDVASGDSRWFPRKALLTQGIPHSVTMEVLDAALNIEIPAATFTPDLPKGSQVYDATKKGGGRSYIVGVNGPGLEKRK